MIPEVKTPDGEVLKHVLSPNGEVFVEKDGKIDRTIGNLYTILDKMRIANRTETEVWVPWSSNEWLLQPPERSNEFYRVATLSKQMYMTAYFLPVVRNVTGETPQVGYVPDFMFNVERDNSGLTWASILDPKHESSLKYLRTFRALKDELGIEPDLTRKTMLSKQSLSLPKGTFELRVITPKTAYYGWLIAHPALEPSDTGEVWEISLICPPLPNIFDDLSVCTGPLEELAAPFISRGHYLNQALNNNPWCNDICPEALNVCKFWWFSEHLVWEPNTLEQLSTNSYDESVFGNLLSNIEKHRVLASSAVRDFWKGVDIKFGAFPPELSLNREYLTRFWRLAMTT